MSIRSAAKAIIIKDEKILLNKCRDENIGVYYTLPGGGQHPYETLHGAVIRECLEETGYTVVPVRFAALLEEIQMDAEVREKDPDYAHKIYHIFVCALANEKAENPTEKDSSQITSEWVAIGALENIRFFPNAIGENIINLLNSPAPVFLGSEHYG
jgi:ADP-ribose pyrophosphatase YjhB (NUDIX family)